jgi:protein-disulfide isomerase-like protein with CxxC motif
MNRRASKVAKGSASRSTVGCAIVRAEPHVERHKGVIYTEHRRQTMDEITYVGLDAHAQTTAIAVAEAGETRCAAHGEGNPRPVYVGILKG